MTLTDFARLVLTTLLFLTGPYCAQVFFTTFVDEPLSLMYACWTYTLLLWLLHHTTPAMDIIRAFGQASPLITHSLPWSQMATSACLAMVVLLAAVRVVQRASIEPLASSADHSHMDSKRPLLMCDRSTGRSSLTTQRLLIQFHLDVNVES
jgi:hypothetical protein